MTVNSTVTIYHYNEEKELWEKSVFPKAHLHYTHSAAQDKGFKSSSTGIIRIPVTADINVIAGDRIYKGSLNCDKPPAEGCMTVTGYADRRRGLNPHWRINVI